MSNYSKSAYAKSLGISGSELESRARSAGYDTTEAYYNSQGGGGSGGGGMINYGNIPSVTDYVTKLEVPITDSYNALITAMQNRANPLDIYTSMEEAAGLPGMRGTATTLRDQISGIEDTIKRVEPTIAATTKESMVTEGQRQQMSMAQKKPLLERLGELTTGLGRVEQGIQAGMQDLATKVSLFMQGQDQMLEPLKIGIQAMTDRASRLTSAFSIDAQNQFNAYLANIRRGWELDDQERDEAFQLLTAENTYKQTLETAAAGAGIRLSGNESNEEILRLIGDAAAEELQFDRTNKGTETPTWPWSTPGSTGSDWVIVPSGSNTSGGGSLQPPQMLYLLQGMKSL